LKEFTIATIENAVVHNEKIIPTGANSSLLTPFESINIKNHRQNITAKTNEIIDIAFINIKFAIQ